MMSYLFKLHDGLMLLLYVRDCVLYTRVGLTHDLLSHELRRCLWILDQSLKLVLRHIWLGVLDLPSHARLHCVFELSLYCLRIPDHLPELVGEGPMDGLLHSCLWLLSEFDLTFTDVIVHQ